ncbi:MAG: hypothetical protein ETSY1_12870 [Candidatus Entotheonella factor]|uniref:ABC transporter n=1 Tax=Entotheonella factor TaxID=1429438 RepID=W4LPI9_ENTF1|nr:MAG: hypothetical protein ETSY1_12870 [Candidatus Entotheonella factor]
MFNLLPTVMLVLIIRTVTSGSNSVLVRLGFVGLRSQLLFLGSAMLLIQSLDLLMEYVQRKTWRDLARSIEHHTRVETFAHVQQLDPAYLENQSSGRLMHILYDDIGQVHRFFESGINDLIRAAMIFVTLGMIFLFLAPSLGLLALLFQPLLIRFGRYIQQQIAPYYREVGDKTDELSLLLTNNLAGLSTVKRFTAEDFEVQRLTVASESVWQHNIRAVDRSSAYASLMRFMFLGNAAAVLTLASILASSGGLSLGAFLLVAGFTGTLLAQLRGMDENYDFYKRSTASAERILHLLETPISIRSGPKALPPEQVRGDITLDHVCFQYHPDMDVLKDFSLRIEAQESLALVGATGCGKTTFVKLLLRFYDVAAGTIYVDGVDIRELSLNDLRTAIGVVSQDVYLFHGTVYDNILYGRRDASRNDVIMAARATEAHDFIINQLPQGYDTIIGERGQKLSGGQQQRLAIARVVLMNPPILILDEATSALDNETEAAIKQSLDRIAHNRTTITIAHRLSTIYNADRICVMDGGRIIEQGRHDELLSLDGIYAALWRMQAGDVGSKSRIATLEERI